MICSRCGAYADEAALTCDNCGSLLSDGRPRETGVKAMRQGRMSAMPPTLPDEVRLDVPEYGDYHLDPMPISQKRAMRPKPVKKGLKAFPSRPSTRRGVPVNTNASIEHVTRAKFSYRPVKSRGVNWMLILVIFAGIALLLSAGYFVYTRSTDSGRRATARRMVVKTSEEQLRIAMSTEDINQVEREAAIKAFSVAPAQSYWLVGREIIEEGDVDKAITAYRIADILDPDNYDGLLLLAAAYELYERDDLAENLYLRISEDVSPSRAEAYTALIRMYQNQSRRPEAAAMMLKGYENTDRETFRLQRKDYIPNQAEVDLGAGRYKMEREVNVTSPQGYDVYYTMDDAAELPRDGILADGPVLLTEGTKNLRAVCVSDDLVSDPIAVTYVVYYPSPAAPLSNLAPNTYSRPQSVRLRPGEGDEKEKLTFYYTIDGSLPTEDSPVYDGTPIKLPNGRVWLRAIAKNGYGKLSSTLEVFYKITAKPYMQKPYSEEDTFGGFQIMRTDMAGFKKSFGEPKQETSTKYLTLDNEARRLDYAWGCADFILSGNTWQLVRVDMRDGFTSAPRGVSIGASLDEVVGAYKDMGQVEYPGGGRGLYYADPEIGRISQGQDCEATVEYYCNTIESNTWALMYHTKDGRVRSIEHFFKP